MDSMSLRHLVLLTLCSALISSILVGQEARSSVEVTADGRTLNRALDGVLGGLGRGEVQEERTVIFLIDPTQAVVEAGFAQEMRQALMRNAGRLAKTRVGVAEIGKARDVTFFDGTDHVAVMQAVDAALASPLESIKNVYQDVRAVASEFVKGSGARALVLVSLDNGDAEDDVEQTVDALEKHDIRFHCITREAFLSDSYWTARPNMRAPRKCRLTGGDGAFVELPWGWLFQITVANEIAPSATAVYPLSRLAAATGGRIYLYSPSSTGHKCAIYGTCLFCSNDHRPSNEIYWRGRLQKFGPSTAPRRKVYEQAAADPAFRAMLKAWRAASRAGLVRSLPSVKIAGKGLAPQRARRGRTWNFGAGSSFSRKAAKAKKLARECDRIRETLVASLANARRLSIPRYRAMATFTVLMLRLTKVNLVTFQGWCEDIAPGLVKESAPEFDAPEVDAANRERRSVGIGISNYCLCHGVRPFRSVELPGGAMLREELQELDAMVRSFESRYGHTPFIAGLHRSGIAHFRLTYPGIARARARRRPRSSQDGPATTPTPRGRPARSGGVSGGAAGTTGR